MDGLYYGVQSTEYRDHPYSFGLTVYMYRVLRTLYSVQNRGEESGTCAAVQIVQTVGMRCIELFMTEVILITVFLFLTLSVYCYYITVILVRCCYPSN